MLLETIKGNNLAKIVITLFIGFTIWWLILQFFFPPASDSAKLYGSLYGIIALLGGIWSISVAGKWGGTKSVMGKSILLFGFGLIAQEFGQVIYSYYNYILKLDPPPYPSIGDIGFFGSIPLYIIGVIYLAKASGVKIGLKSFASKIQAALIPLSMLVLGYYLFLRDYEFDWTSPLTIFLDFGYPLGQAIYVSLAILTYLLSKRFLGGIMKGRILIILFALVIQFISDYMFLYQTIHESWYVGGINDYVYMSAYFVMTLALLQLNTVALRLRE